MLRLAFLTAAVLAVLTPCAAAFNGKVTAVKDGDTLVVVTQYNHRLTVRLFGIDAPEKDQEYGEKSMRGLAKLCGNEKVSVVVTGVDSYRRLIGIVKCKGKNASLTMLRRGHAFAYSEYLDKEPIKLSKRYYIAEAYAKENSKGLWKTSTVTLPWEWRRSHRNAKGR